MEYLCRSATRLPRIANGGPVPNQIDHLVWPIAPTEFGERRCRRRRSSSRAFADRRRYLHLGAVLMPREDMVKHRGFPGRLPGTDFQFTLRRGQSARRDANCARENVMRIAGLPTSARMPGFMQALWEHFGEEPFVRGNLDAGRLSLAFRARGCACRRPVRSRKLRCASADRPGSGARSFSRGVRMTLPRHDCCLRRVNLGGISPKSFRRITCMFASAPTRAMLILVEGPSSKMPCHVLSKPLPFPF